MIERHPLLPAAQTAWKAGDPGARIARLLGVRRQSLERFVSRHPDLFPPRPPRCNPDHGAELFILAAQEFWDEGHSVSAIARKLNVNKNVISGLAHRNRDLFPARGNPISRQGKHQ